MLRLGHIELFVADPVGSMPFYRDALGFELVEVQGDKVVWLKSGDTELLLRPGANDTRPATTSARRSQWYSTPTT